MVKGFLRRSWDRYSKLGKRRKNKQKWKRPTGRDNKMREKRRGYPKVVSVGYSSNKEDYGKINGKKRIFINNLKDLEKATKENIIVIGNIGMKKKIEIIKKAKEKNIEIEKINPEKFLKKNKIKKQDKKEIKK